jgi:hypothetical protein
MLPRRSNTLAAFLLGGLLYACSGTGADAPTKPAYAGRGYQRIIEIQSADPLLQEITLRTLAQRGDMGGTTSVGTGEFRLTLVEEGTRRFQEPRLIGSLYKTKQQANFTVTYTLTDATGNRVTHGRVTATTPTQEVIWPATAHEPVLTKDIAEDIASQIIPQVVPHIMAQPWRVRVMSIVDNTHVTLGLGPESGLKVGDLLTTETYPVASLQVAVFEQISGGSQRAILRLLSGERPQPGRMLIPAQ